MIACTIVPTAMKRRGRYLAVAKFTYSTGMVRTQILGSHRDSFDGGRTTEAVSCNYFATRPVAVAYAAKWITYQEDDSRRREEERRERRARFEGLNARTSR